MDEKENAAESIDYKSVVDQLQHENEELRSRLTQALKGDVVTDTVTEAIDGIILVIQKTDPMRLYMWVAMACMIAIALARFIEVLIK